MRVHLTAAGRAVAAEGAGVAAALDDEVFGVLDAAERRDLAALLARVAERLGGGGPS